MNWIAEQPLDPNVDRRGGYKFFAVEKNEQERELRPIRRRKKKEIETLPLFDLDEFTLNFDLPPTGNQWKG